MILVSSAPIILVSSAPIILVSSAVLDSHSGNKATPLFFSSSEAVLLVEIGNTWFSFQTLPTPPTTAAAAYCTVSWLEAKELAKQQMRSLQ